MGPPRRCGQSIGVSAHEPTDRASLSTYCKTFADKACEETATLIASPRFNVGIHKMLSKISVGSDSNAASCVERRIPASSNASKYELRFLGLPSVASFSKTPKVVAVLE